MSCSTWCPGAEQSAGHANALAEGSRAGWCTLAGWGQRSVNAARPAARSLQALVLCSAHPQTQIQSALKGTARTTRNPRWKEVTGKERSRNSYRSAREKAIASCRTSREQQQLGACGAQMWDQPPGLGCCGTRPHSREAALYIPSVPGWSETGANPWCC